MAFLMPKSQARHRHLSKTNLATKEHELKGNMQKGTWRFNNQCEFVKSVAGVMMLFLFGSGYVGLGRK